MGMWSAAEQLDSLCVALSPVPCKGKKVFWNWLLAFSNAVRHWGEVLAGGGVGCWGCHLLLFLLWLQWSCSIVSAQLHLHSPPPRFLFSFVNTFLKPQMWTYKWVGDEMNAHLTTSPSANTEHCSVISHSLIGSVSLKEKYFLSFGYPDFQTSPVSWQIHNGLGLSVNDTNVWWVTSITSYRLWNQLTFALSLKMEGMRQSCRHTPFTLLIMPTSIFCLWGYLIVVSVKNYPSFH